jgi:hypothetical protein
VLGVRRFELVQDGPGTGSYEEGNELLVSICGEEFLDEEGKRILGRRICTVEDIKNYSLKQLEDRD